MKKIVYKQKAFPNSAGGFLDASAYAKNNNMRLVTTYEDIKEICIRFYNNYKRYPESFMFIFEALED